MTGQPLSVPEISAVTSASVGIEVSAPRRDTVIAAAALANAMLRCSKKLFDISGTGFDPSFFNPSKCCKIHAYARDKILLLVEMHKKKKKLAAGAFCV